MKDAHNTNFSFVTKEDNCNSCCKDDNKAKVIGLRFGLARDPFIRLMPFKRRCSKGISAGGGSRARCFEDGGRICKCRFDLI